MSLSVFNIFKVGIGPSSSHTMGPMKAAKMFLKDLETTPKWDHIHTIKVELYGSLALTGIGHGTDKAVQLGLMGYDPDNIDPDLIADLLKTIKDSRSINLLQKKTISFTTKEHLLFLRKKTLPFHSNGMSFYAQDSKGAPLHQDTYYSFGGGFVATEAQAKAKEENNKAEDPDATLPYPFESGDRLLEISASSALSIPEIMLANEKIFRTEEQIRTSLDHIWSAMEACIERGLKQEGVLPGGLKVKRRAASIYKDLISRPEDSLKDPLTILDWVNLYALSVNEENASGSKVVTAPTNGAAGIIPAVIRYYQRFKQGSKKGIHDFLLTAGAIGILYHKNASLSGAEVGCQGEIGVACSMAAAGLTAALGGSAAQIEQAAEIGMEHNLGLTCDPIGGLVQIPCIERNAMGAVKAINASRIALRGDGKHFVSLDSVIQTMWETGKDMKSKYKETSRGGLAVNVIEC